MDDWEFEGSLNYVLLCIRLQDHTFLYHFIISIKNPKDTGLFISIFSFFIAIGNRCSVKKLCSMIIWF